MFFYFKKFIKYTYWIFILYVIFMSLVWISYFFIHFKNNDYYPSSLKHQGVFNLVYTSFLYSTPWVDTWFQNPVIFGSKSFSLTPYMVIGLVYLFTAIFSIMCFKRTIRYYYLIAISIFYIIFLPYGYVFGSLFLVYGVFLLLFVGQFQMSDKSIPYQKKNSRTVKVKELKSSGKRDIVKSTF